MNLAIDNLFNFCWSVVTTGVLNPEFHWLPCIFCLFSSYWVKLLGIPYKDYFKTLDNSMCIKVGSFNSCVAALKNSWLTQRKWPFFLGFRKFYCCREGQKNGCTNLKDNWVNSSSVIHITLTLKILILVLRWW